MIKKLADKAFKWFCNPEYYPDIRGDLEELYNNHLKNHSKWVQLRYLMDVLLLFRLSLLRPITRNSIIKIKDTGMFKNYFKISVRNLARHKMFTAINVIGLAIGLASFLLIYEYIRFEKSYDSFYTDADQLYRVSYVDVVDGKDGVKDAMSSYLVGDVLNRELPEVVQHTVTKQFDELIARSGESVFKEKRVITADSNFLKLFDYKVLEGDPESMMAQPLSIVLTESRAKAYFGSESAVGKSIEVIAPQSASLLVTGVIEDVPVNTHYKFDILISDKTLELIGEHDYKNWDWNNYYVYLKFAEGANLDGLDEKLAAITKKYVDEENETRLDIHPVRDIYLKSDFTYEPEVLGSEQAVNFLLIISIFILVIAWVNYVNLFTARAIDRAKEVGLRKVIGAFKNQLVGQFMFEAFLVNLIGSIVALIIAELALPVFNQLVGKEIVTNVWNYPTFLLTLLNFWILGSLISGFYPAMVLSGFKPITVLKGKFRTSKSGVNMRKGLVIIQFAASLVLISATFIVYQQVNYMQHRDIGISIDRVVSVTVPHSNAESREEFEQYISKLNSFKETLKNHTAIETVGATSNLPGGSDGDINATTTKVKIVGRTELLDGTTYIQYNDDEFVEAVDMTIIAGRDFDRNVKSDSVAIMVNEAFLQRFGVDEISGVVNQKIQLGTNPENQWKIVGIVKDYNRTTLKIQVEPTLYFPSRSARNLVVELEAQNYQAGLEFLEDTWSEFYPETPIEITFLDNRFELLYDHDKRFGDVFMVFSSLAVLIAILGLYGLASFLSLQRSKEVGVRKVLGASGSQIIYLFYKGFFYLIGISALLGFPLVYFLMNGWLNNYAYRIDFPWLLPVLSLVIVLVFALITVGYQTSKVASVNPAQTLKYE
ncbi:MAG: ABC transporter permease [Cyclobacteriaceae bacterium]